MSTTSPFSLARFVRQLSLPMRHALRRLLTRLYPALGQGLASPSPFGKQIVGLSWGAFAILVDYPYATEVRPLETAPFGAKLAERFAADRMQYRDQISSLAEYSDRFSKIPVDETDSTHLCWNNRWMPSYDAAAIYGFIAKLCPSRYLEIGSGYSTKFARRSIQENSPHTKIISVDPHPRADVDTLCDQIIRSPMEEVDPQVLAAMLSPGDVLFVDGSHRSFQGSDVTIVFTELLPAIKPGVVVGFHDIYLPYDYPPIFKDYFYNEQYLLMMYLLDNRRDRVILPVNYCCHDPDLWTLYKKCFAQPSLEKVNLGGSSFWLITAPETAESGPSDL